MAVKKPTTRLAWVGSITGVFSLIAGIYGGWTFLSGQLERRRAVDGLLASEAVQFQASDYASAWGTLAQAAALDAGSARVQQAREDLAMQWLDNISVPEGETFASITGKLEPALTRGAASAKSPQRQADLLAHLGWSYFLRSREASGPDPEAAYRSALGKDPANPYAHAMWGHWILWNHGGIADASKQFAAALAAPRPALRPYVRSIQLSAFRNEGSYEAEAEIVRVANDIRKEHGDLRAPWPHDILNIYSERLIPPDERTAAFLGAIPPPDHLDTFDWLHQRADPGERNLLAYACIRGALLEAAGRRDEALAAYRALASRFGPGAGGAVVDVTRKAITRLAAAE